MTSRAQLRKTALSLSGTVERVVRLETAAFTVQEKRFASLTRDDEVQLYLRAGEAEEFLATYPTARRWVHGATPIGVRIGLKDIDGQQLNHWVRRAWLSRAPKRLTTQAAAAETATPGAVGDLPKGIGRPATQALINAGITTLAQLRRMGEAELLAMHGVGPKAVGILREALSATGQGADRTG